MPASAPSDTTLRDLRRELHRHPERSGREEGTARRLIGWLEPSRPTELLTGLGGHGIAAIYRAQTTGPRVLVRADMDALPIPEGTDLPHRSTVEGTSHKCGHDGHMTMVAALARRLAADPPARGEVVLLFQPAEETGQGAAAVIADPRWDRIRPDLSLGLHNLPGFPRGSIIVKAGPFASASVGMTVTLRGATSHAAEPEHGRSPALAVASLIDGLSALPQFHSGLAEAAKVTVIHARIGEVAFGTSPGEAVVMATLRAHRGEVLERLKLRAETLARGLANAHELTIKIEWVEEFPATVNDPGLTEWVREAAHRHTLEIIERAVAFPWSEDFGHYGATSGRAVFFGLGSGEDHPALHHPDYDFPDEILPLGTAMFDTLLRRALAEFENR